MVDYSLEHIPDRHTPFTSLEAHTLLITAHISNPHSYRNLGNTKSPVRDKFPRTLGLFAVVRIIAGPAHGGVSGLRSDRACGSASLPLPVLLCRHQPPPHAETCCLNGPCTGLHTGRQAQSGCKILRLTSGELWQRRGLRQDGRCRCRRQGRRLGAREGA